MNFIDRLEETKEKLEQTDRREAKDQLEDITKKLEDFDKEEIKEKLNELEQEKQAPAMER